MKSSIGCKNKGWIFSIELDRRVPFHAGNLKIADNWCSGHLMQRIAWHTKCPAAKDTKFLLLDVLNARQHAEAHSVLEVISKNRLHASSHASIFADGDDTHAVNECRFWIYMEKLWKPEWIPAAWQEALLKRNHTLKKWLLQSIGYDTNEIDHGVIPACTQRIYLFIRLTFLSPAFSAIDLYKISRCYILVCIYL